MPIEPSPAVERALDIISFLADRPGERFTLSELARQLELPRATCNSVVLALADRGALIRHEPGLEYSLGPALISIGEAARDGLPILAIAGKELEPLASTVGLSAVAALRAGAEMVVASVVNLDDPLGVMVRPGQTMPMAPPFGAAFVAWAGHEQIEAWLDRPGDLRPAERDRYRAALAVVRQRGYSVTVNVGGVDRARRDPFRRREQLMRSLVHTEYLPGKLDASRTHRITQMSAPVFDHRGEPALMLLLLGPPYELTAGDIAQLGDQLRAAAARVTERIGGAPPAPE